MLLEPLGRTTCILFSCTLFVHLCTAVVHLTQSFSPTGNIFLKCSATGTSAWQSSVRLGCTLAENEICRENCTRTCLIVDDVPDCSQINSDSVISCEYKELSPHNIEVVYELSKHSIPPDAQWWCNFRGEKSTRFGSDHLEGSLSKEIKGAHHEIERVSLKILPSSSQPKTESKKKTGNIFSLEVIFFISICTALSCILNVFLFLRCHFTRKYINKLSHGGRPNERIESSLCIRNLSKTYRKRKPLRKPYNESMVNRSKAPMTDPIQRKLYNPARLPMRSGSLQQFIFQPITKEAIYDDVHASSVCATDNDSRNRQNSHEIQTPGSARKCIVDQDGTVYVALGHVEEESRSHGGSRSTLLWQPSPKIQKSFPSSPGRIARKSPAMPHFLSGNNSGQNTPLLGNRNEASNQKSANVGYAGIPPVYPQMAPEYIRNEQIRSDASTHNSIKKVFRPADDFRTNLSCVSPPTLFSDPYQGDIEEEDDKFYRDVDSFFDNVGNDANTDISEVPISRLEKNQMKVKQMNNLTNGISSPETHSLF